MDSKKRPVDWKNLRLSSGVTSIFLLIIALAAFVGLIAWAIYEFKTNFMTADGYGLLFTAVVAIPALILNEVKEILSDNTVKNYTHVLIHSLILWLIAVLLAKSTLPHLLVTGCFLLLSVYFLSTQYRAIKAWKEISWVHKMVIVIFGFISPLILFISYAVAIDG